VDVATTRTAAIVGLGPMGLTHAAITEGLGRARVVALVDSDSRLIGAGRKLLPKVEFFSDVREMMERAAPECVYVCTPPPTHVAVVRQVIESGPPKAIFVEKPLATSGAEARAMVEAAQRHHVLGMVGFQKRFNGVFGEAKRRIDTGGIGRPMLLRAHDFTAGPLGPATGWRGEPGAGGAALEWGIHLLDLLLWLFGPPEAVRARRCRVYSERVEDFASVSVKFGANITGFVEIGWNMRDYAPPDLSIEVVGTDGVLLLNEDRLIQYSGADTSQLVAGRSAPEVLHVTQLTRNPPFLLGQPENVWEEIGFHDALDRGLALPNSWEDSFRLLEWIDLIRQAPLE
jgi:predicted dehydrogenase